MMMREDAADSHEVLRGTPLAGENQWPQLANFREPVTACHDAMRDVALRILSLIDRGLQADGALIQAFDVPTTWFRLLHYPPVDVKAPGDVFGSAPHTDFGALTLVAQDTAGGLQVAQENDQWIDVEPIDGAFVMNAGSMLHRWSNGRLRATPHRVRNRGASDRYSCVLFCDPYMSTEIAPLPSCIDDGEASRFEPVIFSDVVAHHLGAIYEQHQN
jgi:isopenicillin N synthase-like dioxygenase